MSYIGVKFYAYSVVVLSDFESLFHNLSTHSEIFCSSSLRGSLTDISPLCTLSIPSLSLMPPNQPYRIRVQDRTQDDACCESDEMTALSYMAKSISARVSRNHETDT